MFACILVSQRLFYKRYCIHFRFFIQYSIRIDLRFFIIYKWNSDFISEGYIFKITVSHRLFDCSFCVETHPHTVFSLDNRKIPVSILVPDLSRFVIKLKLPEMLLDRKPPWKSVITRVLMNKNEIGAMADM